MPIRLLLAAIALSIATPAVAAVKKGEVAANFAKKTLDGRAVQLSALRGKVVLVDFWASWCEPCKKELPILGKMVERLRARGIEIVTVNIDDHRENAEAFVRAHGLAGLTVVTDDDKSVVGKYEPEKMPTSFLIDRAGVVQAVNAGFEDGDAGKLEQQLLSLAAR